MTTSRSAARPSLGRQEPRLWHVPPFVSSLADEILELCEMAGLFLDEWQQLVLRGGMGVRDDGRLSAPEVGACVPRQNGKGGILEAVELGRLFVLQSPLTLHSAHLFDTSLEAYKRLRDLIENRSLLDRQVLRYPSAHGSEGIELRAGPRIRFRTRTKGGGRGFTGDCLILDEAMYLPETAISALVPTISAKRYGQIWYTGSAVDQMTMEDGVVFARVRERGLAGADGLAWYEWSVESDSPVDVDETLALDLEAWEVSNPALGIRIEPETIAREYVAMGQRSFAVERLGVGDWPDTEETRDVVIRLDHWNVLADARSKIDGVVCFAFDVAPDRSSGSIGVSGKRPDGRPHVEVVDRRSGTGWIVDRLVELHERHKPSAVVCDDAGPAASLVSRLEQAGVEVRTVNAKEYAHACGLFYDSVEQKSLRHLATTELRDAIKGATSRTLGEAWAWSRKNSGVDISPLVAITLALWGSQQVERKSSWRPL